MLAWSFGFRMRRLTRAPDVLFLGPAEFIAVMCGAFRLGRFIEVSGVLPTTQFADRKGLGACDVLLCVVHTLQNALEMWQEARIVLIDFSAAFDRVNHQGILFKLCSVGAGGSVLSVLTQFLSNRSQYVTQSIIYSL